MVEQKIVWKTNYITTKDNVFADSLSRGDLARFAAAQLRHDRAYNVDPSRIHVPEILQNLFPGANWTLFAQTANIGSASVP